MTKYKLTNETKVHDGITLHRIELTEDCRWGKKGTKGGWIESMDNLGEDGWVSGNAHVYGNAKVSGNAWVYENAEVYGDAQVFGNAMVTGGAMVYGNAMVTGGAMVYGNAMVYGEARVYGNAMVYGEARVYGNAMVYGEVRVYGEACVWGDAKVCFKMILIGGQWDSTPMCLHLSDDVTMNMSGPGILRIGNQHKPIGEWLEDKNFKYRRYVWIFVDEYGLGDVHNCDQEK